MKNPVNSNKVAVILVNYNGIKDTIECIESLLQIKNISDIKIVVVDNASANNEAQMICDEFPMVHTIRSNVNGGFSAGNNLGIKYALKEGYGYILILNNDTIIYPDMVPLLKAYCTNEWVAVPKMLYYSTPGKVWFAGGFINRITGNAEHIGMNKPDNQKDCYARQCTFATGCCIMISSEVFSKVGLFNEDFFMYCEDTEFCIRLSLNGIKIKYVPEAKLLHKISSSTGGSESPFSTYYITRNRLNYVKQYKKFFYPSAYMYSLATRYIRMLCCKELSVRKALYKAIKDHRIGVAGKSYEERKK